MLIKVMPVFTAFSLFRNLCSRSTKNAGIQKENGNKETEMVAVLLMNE